MRKIQESLSKNASIMRAEMTSLYQFHVKTAFFELELSLYHSIHPQINPKCIFDSKNTFISAVKVAV